LNIERSTSNVEVLEEFVRLQQRGEFAGVVGGKGGERQAEFAENGIVLDNSSFECRPEGKDTWLCRDKHPDFGVFKYGINLTVKDSPFGPRGVQSLDPWIVNH
jgi:hypothetical protein